MVATGASEVVNLALRSIGGADAVDRLDVEVVRRVGRQTAVAPPSRPALVLPVTGGVEPFTEVTVPVQLPIVGEVL